MGQPISKHVPKIKTDKDSQTNAVYQVKDSDEDYSDKYHSNYGIFKPVINIEGEQVNDESIHGGLYMAQFSYKEVHFMVFYVNYQILHNLGQNWDEEDHSEFQLRYQNECVS